VPEEAMSGYVDRVKEAYPSMNGFRRVEAEGALTVTGSLESLRRYELLAGVLQGNPALFLNIVYNLKQ
jgi:hypothetical protein